MSKAIKKKPSRPTCPVTKIKLHGVPHLRVTQLNRLSKTQKRPQRPFGGNLSSKAMREAIKQINQTIGAPLDIGQVCIKIAGRDAGKIAVVIDKPKNNFVMIDGQVRRRKCNISHLIAVDKKIKIKQNATTEIVIEGLKSLGIKVTKTKPKKPLARQKRIRKTKRITVETKPKEEKPGIAQKNTKDNKAKSKNGSKKKSGKR